MYISDILLELEGKGLVITDMDQLIRELNDLGFNGYFLVMSENYIEERNLLINACKFYRHFFSLYIKHNEILADEYNKHKYYQNKINDLLEIK